MADFCTECSKEMGFPVADINETEIFSKLEKNQYLPVLCEGCGMLAIGRGEDGKMMYAYTSEEDEDMVVWTSLHKPLRS